MPQVLEGGQFSQYSYNDWKHRIIFVVLMHLNRSREHITKEFKGGSIYTLFQTHFQFQQNAVFSFRGSDCYILAHGEDVTISYRLRLADALHLTPRPNFNLGTEKKSLWGNIVLEPKNRLVIVNLGESRWIF
ncbi:hypothetical protein THRCLA_20636 [Thraustotheca clavata]|uniref:Uncharacterized protein n=1 Tax=Thraustotheca clavata TaxID=74557 RepID=A0A1W0A594_9STRA|nr:hypothetical protein THRCLA_20636 [Thraustotheca clavata]